MTSLNEFTAYPHSRPAAANGKKANATSNVKRSKSSSTKPAAVENASTQSIQSELDVLATLTLNETPSTSESRIAYKECLLNLAAHQTELVSLIRHVVEDGRGEGILSLTHDPLDPNVKIQLTPQQYDLALENIKAVCAHGELNCAMTELYSVEQGGDKSEKKQGFEVTKVGRVLVRERALSVSQLLEIRVAVVGNVDAGKSTLLGVLTKGGLDDGRGKARVNLFRHKHEIETGRTSSVGMEIMGFDETGRTVGTSGGTCKASWKEIVAGSRKVLTFIDLAGHEKYLKTTVFGLMGGSPDFVMLMVGANAGMIGMAKEHLGVALALNVPVFICVTKIDMCPENVLQSTINQISKILRSPGCRKMPIFIGSNQDVAEAATNFVSQRICPIFQISSVTGQGLDYVRMFLNLLPFHGQFDETAPLEFEINDTFSVPFVGTVVSGVILSGTVHVGDSVYIGPDSLGQFTSTAIRSIERKRQGVDTAHAGQSVSFAMKKIRRRDVRKGMVVLAHGADPPRAVREFVAEVLILQHATTIKTRYQAMLHVGAVAQTCTIVELDRPYIRTGDRATVKFRFMLRPEYIRPGQKVLFREGRTRGLGVVKDVSYGT
ncbi:P-loop containing nucleoside triphosphate hydrolase protein [Lipomyces kononenkoae]|uniref:P-loop containing nucleoside triphosphate hydrolase protein n=1 Tax=Lipomyces kononenkoae TaxID=34357 RepID=A0ACC3TBK1_LIPKO